MELRKINEEAVGLGITKELQDKQFKRKIYNILKDGTGQHYTYIKVKIV